MALDLTQVKNYLRVDGNDSDDDISALMLAAAKYINGMTGKTKVVIGIDSITSLPITVDISNDELYNLANKLIIAHWYENRGVELPGTLTKISHSIDALVNHIAICSDYV